VERRGTPFVRDVHVRIPLEQRHADGLPVLRRGVLQRRVTVDRRRVYVRSLGQQRVNDLLTAGGRRQDQRSHVCLHDLDTRRNLMFDFVQGSSRRNERNESLA